MASISVYYQDGDFEEFTTTPLPFENGYLIQNEFIHVKDIESEGVVWERSFFAIEKEDPEGIGGTIRSIQIVPPENLYKIEGIFINNLQVYPKAEDTNAEDEANNELSVSNNKLTAILASDSIATKTDVDTSSTESEPTEETEVIISKAVETEQPDTSTDDDTTSPIPEDDSPVDFTPTDDENIDYSSLLGSYLSDLEENSTDEDQ